MTISLDLLSHYDNQSADIRIQELFKKNNKKRLKNALLDIIPMTMTPVIIKMAGIDIETECNTVTKEERMRLVGFLKNTPARVSGLPSAERSIVASGGVIPEEIDFKTMRSRLFPNLYIIGDTIDIDRVSGGYSLQLCWTTGYIAGDSIPTDVDL